MRIDRISDCKRFLPMTLIKKDLVFQSGDIDIAIREGFNTTRARIHRGIFEKVASAETFHDEIGDGRFAAKIAD